MVSRTREYLLGLLLGVGLVLIVTGVCITLIAEKIGGLFSSIDESLLARAGGLAKILEELNTSMVALLYKSLYNNTSLLRDAASIYEKLYPRLPEYERLLKRLEPIVESSEYDELVSLLELVSHTPLLPVAHNLSVIVEVARDAKLLVPRLARLIEELKSVKPSVLQESVRVLEVFAHKLPPDKLEAILGDAKVLSERFVLLEREYKWLRGFEARLQLAGVLLTAVGASLAAYSLTRYMLLQRRR